MNQKVWGGRFREEIDSLTNRFNSSILFDRRLYRHDIEGSIVYSKMLAKKGIITEEESSQIISGLQEINRALESGELTISEDYEDIHSFVEKALVERIGAVGEKLHTGRSRNDQVALDLRLYLMETINRLVELIREMQREILGLAEKNATVLMPGYTHLQRAQPVLLGHYLLAYIEMFTRDRQRFEEGYKRVNVLPLGSAALAGSSFDLDREMLARELGFEAISENSMDAVSDRDFVLEFLFDASVLMMHLSRLSEELVIWCSREFGFISIPDAFCTGSSIMPQKKNPDVPELVRGKTGRTYGNLVSLLTTMKGLPLTYNKDLQEDKEAIFDTADSVASCLTVTTRLLGGISFNENRMKEATEEGYLMATDLADYLVTRGLTFRNAHELVGRIVLYAIDHRKELHELTMEELTSFSRNIGEDVYEWLIPSKSVEKKKVHGGTAPQRVKERLIEVRRELES